MCELQEEQITSSCVLYMSLEQPGTETKRNCIRYIDLLSQLIEANTIQNKQSDAFNNAQKLIEAHVYRKECFDCSPFISLENRIAIVRTIIATYILC